MLGSTVSPTAAELASEGSVGSVIESPPQEDASIKQRPQEAIKKWEMRIEFLAEKGRGWGRIREVGLGPRPAVTTQATRTPYQYQAKGR